MNFIKKRLFLLIALLIVYSAFFFTHIHSPIHKTVLGTTTNLFLLQQPQAGKDPLLSAINSSAKEIDIGVYLLSDKDIIASLISAHQRGVQVKVMLEEHPFGGGAVNIKTKQALETEHMDVKWSNSVFSLTHEKIMIIDGKQAFILNQNLTASSFTKNREYDIVDNNVSDITEIKKIFDADWNRSSFSQSNENLVISPESSREKLTALIISSLRTIDGEIEVIDDPEIIHTLESKAFVVRVRLILPDISQIPANKKALNELTQHGIDIKTIKNPYIHAKLLIIDDKKAYIGSINFTTQSLDSNREVGILISQSDIVSELLTSFSTDWDNASKIDYSN